MGDITVKVECDRHGEGYATFVCQHLAHDSARGFFHGGSDGEARPDAWCLGCDLVREAHGEWNDESEAIAGITLLCSACYDEVRERNEGVCPSLEENGWRVGYRDELVPPVPNADLASRSEIDAVQPGTWIKALFFIANETDGETVRGERMWVRVARLAPDSFIGVLDSEPATLGSLREGRVVNVPKEAVFAVLREDAAS